MTLPGPALENPPGTPSRRRRWTRIALWLLGVYTLSAVVLVTCEERIAFPGWTFGKPFGTPPGVQMEAVTIGSPDGSAVEAWWLPPPAWTPSQGAVIYLHGNSENLFSCHRTLIRWREEMQVGVVGLDYPGFGHSTGTPNEESCYAAAQAVFDWLVREKSVRARDIIVVGQSMGAAVALELANRQPCRMLVISGAFTSFPAIAQHRFFWLPARYLTRMKFDSLGKIGSLAEPVFIAHGAADHVVPISQGEQLFAAAREPKRFWSAPDLHHAQPKTPEFFAAVRAFFNETRQPVQE